MLVQGLWRTCVAVKIRKERFSISSHKPGLLTPAAPLPHGLQASLSRLSSFLLPSLHGPLGGSYHAWDAYSCKHRCWLLPVFERTIPGAHGRWGSTQEPKLKGVRAAAGKATQLIERGNPAVTLEV